MTDEHRLHFRRKGIKTVIARVLHLIAGDVAGQDEAPAHLVQAEKLRNARMAAVMELGRDLALAPTSEVVMGRQQDLGHRLLMAWQGVHA